MLGSENLQAEQHWLRRARLWRFILLQQPQGYWDCCQGLALAVLSVKARPKPGVAARTSAVLPALLDWHKAGDQLKKATADGVGEGAEALGRSCPFSGFDAAAIETTVRVAPEGTDASLPE